MLAVHIFDSSELKRVHGCLFSVLITRSDAVKMSGDLGSVQ
jgi:hypothetical protein